MSKEINWEARFHELAEAVRLLDDTCESGATCCDSSIPNEDAWDYLSECARHYSQQRPVRKLRPPNI